MIILVFGWKTATGPTEPNRENPAVSIGTNKPTISPIYKESMDWGTEKKIEHNISKKQCVGRFLQSQKKGKLPACTKPFRGSRLSTRETTIKRCTKEQDDQLEEWTTMHLLSEKFMFGRRTGKVAQSATTRKLASFSRVKRRLAL